MNTSVHFLVRASCCVLVIVGIAAIAADAATYHVAPGGSDSNAGTEGLPWRTLGKAADSVSAGDTVLVAGGVYNEILVPTVSGLASAWIEFAAAPGQTPVIDGAASKLSNSREGLVYFAGDVAYVRLRGFEIRNIDNRGSASFDPNGIAFRGAAHHIEVINCAVHSMSTHREDNTPKGISIEGTVHDITIRGGSISNIRASKREGNAHGIAVYGEQRASVDAVSIEGVDIHNLSLGTSEALVFNGNVTNFRVVGNRIHDCDNIGIDVIGFEGVGPRGFDQARDGHIVGNEIHNISTRNNPAYGDYSAGGIYVDGGKDLIIERNRVHHCDLGIELASENPGGATSGVTARDNVIWRNATGGILLGGYDTRRGAAEDCVIANNTFFENDTRRFEIGEVNIRHRANRNIFINNIFKAGAQGYFVTFPVEFAASAGNIFDGNCYFTAARETGWEWRGRWAPSLSSFRDRGSHEANGVYGDPQFTDSESLSDGLALSGGSWLINRGIPRGDAATRLDAAGNPRVSGTGIDVGAYEWQGGAIVRARVEALRISSTGTARAINLDPTGDDSTGLRVEFSANGTVWDVIARRDSDWSAVDGVSVGVQGGTINVLDARPIPAGFYRAVTPR